MRYVTSFALSVALLVPVSAAQDVPTQPSLQPAEREGQRLFLQRCSVCHWGAPPNFIEYGPILSRTLVERLGDERVREIILDGSPRMPGFRHALDAQTVDALIAYLKTLDDFERPNARTPPSAVVLAGTVRSDGGTVMEGVAVSVRGVTTATMTTTVFTDTDGRYVFPPLDSGRYQVWGQAVGYEAGRADVRLDDSSSRQDLALAAVDDFTMQLSGPEWMDALPEDTPARRRMKHIFHNACGGCHNINFVLQNRFDEAGWLAIVRAMSVMTSTRAAIVAPSPLLEHHEAELAAYLAEMRGPDPSPMEFRLLPRPTGASARAVITEYEIPPKVSPDETQDPTVPGQVNPHNGSDWSQGVPSNMYALGPHDMAVDFNGTIWTNDLMGNKVRTYVKVDPKTGHVTNFGVPAKDGYMRGSHGMVIGRDGYVWLNLFAGAGLRNDPEIDGGQGSLGRIDPNTDELTIFTPPAGVSGVGGHLNIDGKGKVWASTRTGALRFDPDTEQFTEFRSETATSGGGATYGVAGDADGNGWWAIITADTLGVSDLATGEAREVRLDPQTEIAELMTSEDRRFYRETFGELSGFNANVGLLWAQAPRRLGGDPTGRVVWSANFWGQSLAAIDIRTHEVTLHPAPIPFSGPYHVDVDEDHAAWVALRSGDRIGRLDPRTQQWTTYLLPTLGAEPRFITVDRPTGDVWVTYARTGKLARLQMRSESQLRAATSGR